MIGVEEGGEGGLGEEAGLPIGVCVNSVCCIGLAAWRASAAVSGPSHGAKVAFDLPERGGKSGRLTGNTTRPRVYGA